MGPWIANKGQDGGWQDGWLPTILVQDPLLGLSWGSKIKSLRRSTGSNKPCTKSREGKDGARDRKSKEEWRERALFFFLKTGKLSLSPVFIQQRTWGYGSGLEHVWLWPRKQRQRAATSDGHPNEVMEQNKGQHVQCSSNGSPVPNQGDVKAQELKERKRKRLASKILQPKWQ